MYALGLKWKNIGSESPSRETELINTGLAEALKSKVEFDDEKSVLEFTKEEFNRFQLYNLSSDRYIKVGDSCFKPAAGYAVWIQNVVTKYLMLVATTSNLEDRKAASFTPAAHED